jgi:hypothetical protein
VEETRYSLTCSSFKALIYARFTSKDSAAILRTDSERFDGVDGRRREWVEDSSEGGSVVGVGIGDSVIASKVIGGRLMLIVNGSRRSLLYTSTRVENV